MRFRGEDTEFRFADSTDLEFVKACFSDWVNQPTNEQLEADLAVWSANSLVSHETLPDEAMNSGAMKEQAFVWLVGGVETGLIIHRTFGRLSRVTHHLIAPGQRGKKLHTRMVAEAFEAVFELLDARECEFQVLAGNKALYAAAERWGFENRGKTMTMHGQQVINYRLTRAEYRRRSRDLKRAVRRESGGE